MKRQTFIGMVREKMVPRYERWKSRTDVHPAVKEYMTAISDPYSDHFKASYYSFRKGQEMRDRMVKDISGRYGVDERMLRDAYLRDIAGALHGRS